MKCHVFSIGIIVVLLGVTDSNLVNNASYVGCFNLAYSLAHNYHFHIPQVNLEKCVTKCSLLRTKYAGLETSDNFCYCGEDIAEQSLKREDSQCNVQCSDADLTCGGYWLMSVYDLTAGGTTDAEPHERDGVGFLIGLSVGVRLYNSSRLDTYETLMTTQDWVYSVDYHYAENLVFVFSKGALYRTSLRPTPEMEATLVRAVSHCDGFAVDWVRDKIYWANCTQGSNKIIAMGLRGENTTDLLHRPEAPAGIKRMELDPYKGVLFWTADATIESCDLNGNNFRTNLSAPGVAVRSLALDLEARRVYYVGSINESRSLYSMDYDGGASQEHYNLPQLKSLYGLSLFRGQVYWVNYASVRDVIYTAPLQSNGTPTVRELKIIDRAVWHMRAVHPDLQRRPRRDPCQDKGCEHLCTIVNSTLARCQCPEGQELNTDGVSCSGVADSGRFNNASYVGCFDPSNSLIRKHIPQVNLEKCVNQCSFHRTKYAGLGASDNFCYCGEDIPQQQQKREDWQCNVQCSDAADLTCGGDWLMSVYEITTVRTTDAEPYERDGVGFLIGLSVGVWLYNPFRLDTYDTVITTQDWVYSVDYHYAENLVFVFTKDTLYRTSLRSTPALDAIPISAGSTCDGFAVDWVRDKIYLANCTQGSNKIIAMGLRGENATDLLQRPEVPAEIKRMEVDPYMGVLIWTADGTIESCDLNGNNFKTNLSAPGIVVRSIALDLEARRVYYVGSIDASRSLYSMDYDGGASQEHYSLPQLSSVYGLSLFQGQVYWVNYANARDVIYTAPLQSNGTPTVQMIKILDRAVWHMRVVHPDLQRRPKRDPCQDKGCEYLCTIVNSTVARCYCPKGQELNTDGVSCPVVMQAMSEQHMSAAVVGGGLLLVVGVVLVSVLFVYLADRYWSQLQTKLLGISYSRNRGTDQDPSVTSAYDREDDHVSLI